MQNIENKILTNRYALLRTLLVFIPIHICITFFVFKNSISEDITTFSFLFLFTCYTLFFIALIFIIIKDSDSLDYEDLTPSIGVLIFIILLSLDGLFLFAFLFINNIIVSFILNFAAFILFLFYIYLALFDPKSSF